MKKVLKSSKKTLIVCILLIALTVASCFSIPYVMAYFSITQDLNGSGVAPEFMFTPTFKSSTQTTVNMAGNTETMYVSNTSITARLYNLDLAVTPQKVTADCLLRIRVSVQLSSSNTVTEQTLMPLTTELNAYIETNWIVASDTAGNSLQDVATYYLYYKGQVSANSTNSIQVLGPSAASSGDYDGLYLVSNAYVEAIEASKAGAQKWLNGKIGELGGWENTWYSSLGNLA